MILTKEQIKELIPKEELKDTDCINLLETYIKDRTNQEVQINTPDNIIRVQLMSSMFNTAVKYYAERL